MNNNNDKKLIKSPFYSPEDIEKYSYLLQRGLADIKTLGEDPEQILTEKAQMLALFILQTVRTLTEDISKFGDLAENSDGKNYSDKGKFVSLGELSGEIASIFLLSIDKLAFSLLKENERNFFVDTFQENFIALALLKNYRENAYAMESAYISDLNKCFNVYIQFQFDIKDDENPKGTRLHEFAKNAARIIGKEGDTTIISLIETLMFTNLLRSLELEKKLLTIGYKLSDKERADVVATVNRIVEYPELENELISHVSDEDASDSGIKKDADGNTIFDLTEGEREEVKMYFYLFKDYAVNPEFADAFRDGLTAKGLSAYAIGQIEVAKIDIDNKDKYIKKAIEAIAKAHSIHKLPIYFYDFATYIEMAGNSPLAKKTYNEFLDLQSKFKSDKISDMFLTDRDVNEAIAVAKTKLV